MLVTINQSQNFTCNMETIKEYSSVRTYNRTNKLLSFIASVSSVSLLLQLINALPSSYEREIILIPNGLSEDVKVSRNNYSEHYLKQLTSSIADLLVNKSYKNIQNSHNHLLKLVYSDSLERIKKRLDHEYEDFKALKLETKLEYSDAPKINYQLLKGEIRGVIRYYMDGHPMRDDQVKIVLTFNNSKSLLLENYEIFVIERRMLQDGKY